MRLPVSVPYLTFLIEQLLSGRHVCAQHKAAPVLGGFFALCLVSVTPLSGGRSFYTCSKPHRLRRYFYDTYLPRLESAHQAGLLAEGTFPRAEPTGTARKGPRAELHTATALPDSGRPMARRTRHLPLCHAPEQQPGLLAAGRNPRQAHALCAAASARCAR